MLEPHLICQSVSVFSRMSLAAILMRCRDLFLLVLLASGLASAQTYPNKPVKLVVGFPPGGGIDITARMVQIPLQEALKQPVIIEYKPGVGGLLAAAEVARAPADGYTLLVANTGPFAIAPYLQTKAPYDPLRAFSYIGQISQGSYIAVTRADHPAKNLKEFADWARANPGKVNFASGGSGSSTHLSGEMFNQVTGLELTHVPYKGSSPAVQDLIGGQTHLLIDAGTVLLPQIKGGKLKALAVTGARRDSALPEVPTAAELGIDLRATGFQGLVGPAGMSKEVVERLAGELAKVLAQPEVKTRFAAAGADLRYLGPEAFAGFVREENERWIRLIKVRKIQMD